MFRNITKKSIHETVRSLTVILIVSFLATLVARFSWIFDLFSHFPVYHVIGGFVLAPALVYFKHKKWAACALIVAILSTVKIYSYVENHKIIAQSSDEVFTVIQYNRFAIPRNQSDLKEWLTANKDSFDLIILQEANEGLAAAVSEIGNIYPFQIQEPRLHSFGMVILSKHPLLEIEKIKTAGSFAAKFSVNYNNTKSVTVYALHAQVPLTSIRDMELETVSRLIAQDKSENIIFIGDWNITPYSPRFDQIIQTTGLKDQFTGAWPVSTWPSFIPLNFLRLPIDHILFKGELKLVEKQLGPAMGSDHHSLIAIFSIPD